MRKNIIAFITVFFLSFALVYGGGGMDTTVAGQKNREETAKNQVDNLSKAIQAYPTPLVKNFLERKTISDWVKRWDTPDIVCYCYFFVGSQCIGYFVTHGKPASTQSYLIPEDYDIYDTSNSSSHTIRQAPDLDGTYGSNNAGYRFFLANGTAVEASGVLVSCIYADAPLNLQCPQIQAIKH